MFTVADVHWFLDLVEELGREVWLDGGWGVDALVGRPTRPHRDLDIALRSVDGPVLQRALERCGFTEVDLKVRRPFNFVYAHEDGRRIDFHLFDLDSAGDGRYGDTGEVYPALGLSGRGAIDGRPVRCIEASTAVQFRVGYEHDDGDVHDVRLLCETFGIPLPPQYR